MTTPAPGTNRNGRDEQRQDAIVTQTIDAEVVVDHMPVGRPWFHRSNAQEVERRFRIDKAGWRRRIDCARRLSYDARDEFVAPYHGRWTR